ncbi:HlyD family secretion protein [Niabella sp. W65]|nr:HlyD family secretion protein [Niabella sp. W65]MCH7364050.1 HlyD family secretion protein [Niabella sp. W65]
METLVPQSNFGKVTTGQKVILRFEAYPWQEFGTLTGTIDYISPIPVDSGYYLAKIQLPEKLVTNHHKEIPFVEGLKAQSEIVTKDMRLAESLYYDLVKTIRK